MSDSEQKMKRVSNAYADAPEPVLSWPRVDPERRIGLPAGRDTAPHPFTSILLASVATAIVYVAAWQLRAPLGDAGGTLWIMLTGYSGIPIGIVSLSMWAASILVIKWLKITGQRKALLLDHQLLPNPDYRLTRGSVDEAIDALESKIGQPDRFLLISRLTTVLRNVRNVGRVADIDEMFASAADSDEARMESSYTVVRGFIWAIPVLGFIGTILGLTEAISRFGGVLGEGMADKEFVTQQLGEVIAGLDTAFVTTGEGLVAALVLQLAMVTVRRADEMLLDDIRTTCSNKILSRVRISESKQS